MSASPDPNPRDGPAASPGPAKSLAEALSAPVAAVPPGEVDATWMRHERLVIITVDAVDAAVDAKDWAAARALFADRVAVDLRSLGGPATELASADLVGGWATALAAPKTSLHLRTNHLVRFTDGQTRAVVDSHGYAWNAWQGRIWEVWGTYRHTLRLDPQAGWKVDGFAFWKTLERGDAEVPRIVPPG